MKIRNLQINHMNNPTGIAPDNISVSYQISDCRRQTAFRITVTDYHDNVVYDSDIVRSSERHYRLPESLEYKKSYRIAVTAFDENNQSGMAFCNITTGIAKSDWKAEWINPELSIKPYDENVASYLFKTFVLTAEQLAEAKENLSFLYVTCHGLMTIRINGADATEHLLLPGTQQYNKRLMVETIEVSGLLREGENEIVVALGNGWYRGTMGFEQNRNVYGEDIALLFQLEIAEKVVVVSDGSWEASQNGPIGHNDFMDGESYDARKENITDRHPVKTEDFGFDNLINTDTVPITAHETFSAKLITTPANEKVLDFGQNLVGYVSFSIKGKSGQTLSLIHGETLDGKGNFTVSNFQNPKKHTRQQIDYIFRDGENTYHPTMTYMGFRYVKVLADFDIREEDFTATAIYSDIPVTATFSCGNKKVNKLFENALWSMKGNFVDVPTDCPTREKSGYSGDCQAFIHTAMYLMDCYPVYRKWIMEQQAGQFENGLIPQISPNKVAPGTLDGGKTLFKDGGIGWADSFEIVPYRLYERYGELELAEEIYDSLVRWTEYEMRRAKKTRFLNRFRIPRHLSPYIIDADWMWGEWLEPNTNLIRYMTKLIYFGDPEIGGAFYYQHLSFVSKIAHLLGREEDSKRFGDEAEKVKAAYRELFIENGVPKENKRQCRLVRPIAHNLLSEEEKAETAKKLAGMIRNNDNHLNTGFLTTHELCRVLTRYGQEKCSYDLFLQESAPCWLNAVNKGCTTIPESWNCFDENGEPHDSFNHYSYGAVAGWMMDSIAGINIAEKKIVIQPYPDSRLGYVYAGYDSPLGMIVSNWEYKNDGVHYHIEIPAGEKAVIRLKGMDAVEVESGSYDFVMEIE